MSVFLLAQHTCTIAKQATVRLQLTVFNAEVEQPGAHWLGFQINFIYDVCFFLCTRRIDPDRNFGILPWFYIMPWIKAMLHAAAERLRYGATISDLIGCSCSYISWLIWIGEKFHTLYSSVYSTILPVIFFTLNNQAICTAAEIMIGWEQNELHHC